MAFFPLLTESFKGLGFQFFYFNLKTQLKLIMVKILQILTDAALLKRQKLEIEELRSKLQVIIIYYFGCVDERQTLTIRIKLMFRGLMLGCWSKRF